MGDTTGITWTDSTMNFWEGCTKVGPGCDFCYAEDRDKRYHGGEHWGVGAPRRQMSQHTRNNAIRWQKKAGEFLRMRGHHQRVFCSSLADIFDNEVPAGWRADAFEVMEDTPDLRWQLCTKRVSNIEKMVPWTWKTGLETPVRVYNWPKHVGILITVVTPEEVVRDVPRLIELKRKFGIPWIGLSIEPMISDVADALRSVEYLAHIDWFILGGESGHHARECDIHWIRKAIKVGFDHGQAVFVKQMGDKATYGGEPLQFTGKGVDPAEWPEDLRLQQFPAACG